MIEFDEYKVKLNNIRPKLDALSDSLGIEAAKEEIERLHAQIDSDGFWDNQEVSQKVMKQSRLLESKVELYERMCSQWDDLYTLCEMAIEEGDDSMLPELTEGYAQLEQEMEKARLETLLSGEYDSNNAIVSFQAGAGGTEAQDWAKVLNATAPDSMTVQYFFGGVRTAKMYAGDRTADLKAARDGQAVWEVAVNLIEF